MTPAEYIQTFIQREKNFFYALVGPKKNLSQFCVPKNNLVPKQNWVRQISGSGIFFGTETNLDAENLGLETDLGLEKNVGSEKKFSLKKIVVWKTILVGCGNKFGCRKFVSEKKFGSRKKSGFEKKC